MINKIKIEKNVKYLSEIMEDLPHNAFIDKGVTACGGTTIVLTNNEPYVIAVHSIALLKNKCEQHKNVLGVYGETTSQEINEFIEFGGKKIIVTYDSLHKLLQNIEPKKFRLLVDEVQVLIRYAGLFKSKVCNKLINNSFEFKSVSYMTATAPPYKYLPSPMKKLEYYKYIWQNTVKPNINHLYVGNQVSTKTVSYILDKYANTNSDIFVFYNSRTGVANTIKKLIKAEPDITKNAINIFFSKNEQNEEYFKKQLGQDFDISVPLATNQRRINFVSSFGFEGVDFYNKDVAVLVVSDPRYKSMRYDISIDLQQIVGRFRLCRYCDIDFIWSTYTDQISMSEEDFIDKFKTEHDEAKKALTGENAKNKQIQNAFFLAAKSSDSPHYYVDRDDKDKPLVTINQYAFESMMSSYHAMYNDYYVIDDQDKKECKGLERVNDIFIVNESLDIPSLSFKHSCNLKRVFNFKDLAKEYVKTLEELEIEPNDIENQQKISEILDNCEEIKKYHGVLTPKDYKKCVYVKKRLNDRYNEVIVLSKITKKDFKLKVGAVYSGTYLKNEIQRVYNIYDLDVTAKASDIKNWYEVKNTTQVSNNTKKHVSAYKLVK